NVSASATASSAPSPGLTPAASTTPVHDPGEVVGIERRPAYEGSVDLRHRHQLSDVPRLDAAAVLNPHRVRGAAVELPQYPADHADRLVGVVGRGVAAGADGPDRLVRHHA